MEHQCCNFDAIRRRIRLQGASEDSQNGSYTFLLRHDRPIHAGYLPRDGHVSLSQVLEATARGFNMGTDLSLVLAVFAILTDGDPVAQTWYLGTGPDGVGGLNRHSTVEADVSPNKEDFYNGCGDNHHLSSRIFKNNVALVRDDPNKEFSYDLRRQRPLLPTIQPLDLLLPLPSIVSVVAFNFYPEFFSNGTYGAGGIANYESIASIVGANYSEETGNYELVPPRLTDGFTRIYPADPITMLFGQIGTPNVNVSPLLCNIYQGLNSITPLAIAGESEVAQAAVTDLIARVAGVLPAGSIDGCPTDTISSNYLYPNSTTAGGPLGPSLNIERNAGNNVYNQVYFTEAPEKPDCWYVQ
ncbi:hypothetical protein EJ03DRAFT_375180 [Teratosphaeria nubilosa]|uniref:Heme haloperoxidase family profile domain-containing protein n=1 Tax=Teratosphaeria nubilosa TaxID=161662 RepID=A0A6G1L7R0_9PEZI|nr:hypothetical protein EJ03DRAFT_375180 [Teratosphaeria nubilosa]